MELKEKIEKTKTGYVVKTEAEATEQELKDHLKRIIQIRSDYEKEIQDLTKGIYLTADQNKLLEDMNRVDEYRALELHKSKVGNVEKRIRDLKEAIDTIATQIKNREELFK